MLQYIAGGFIFYIFPSLVDDIHTIGFGFVIFLTFEHLKFLVSIQIIL
jgi:hypothetical protein